MIFAILFFIAYSIVAFFIENIYVLVGFTAFNILCCFIFRTGFVRTLKNLWSIFWFALLVFLINLIFDGVISSLIVLWRIYLVANFSFIMSRVFKPSQIASGIAQLFYPLKIFKINTENIALVIVIALNFIPIVSGSLRTLKASLRARGFKFNLKNLFREGHIIFVLYFTQLFKRVSSIEQAFQVRGYNPDAK